MSDTVPNSDENIVHSLKNISIGANEQSTPTVTKEFMLNAKAAEFVPKCTFFSNLVFSNDERFLCLVLRKQPAESTPVIPVPMEQTVVPTPEVVVIDDVSEKVAVKPMEV